MQTPTLAKPVLRRGLATLADALVAGTWIALVIRRGPWDLDWIFFGIFVGWVLWADLKPYWTSSSRVQLAKKARRLLMLRSVVLLGVIATAPYVQRRWWSVAAVVLLFFVGALLRVVEIRRPLRLITAAAGGGFQVRYPADESLDAEIAKLPGVEREGDGWKVAASAESAEALLRFAREHQFEFTPNR